MKHLEEEQVVTVICYSCVTGEAVWLYQGPTRQAARVAYRRACERELKRVHEWDKMIAERKANIKRLLSDCMAEIPISASMTLGQQTAARQLLSIAGSAFPCCRDFYNHIVEERRRRDEDRRLRQQRRAS